MVAKFHTADSRVHAILGAIGSSAVAAQGAGVSPNTVEPFVTIAEQPGAGGRRVGELLVDALNTDLPITDRPWSYWDRQLVEKVAADHHLSQRLIDSLDTAPHSWFAESLESFRIWDTPDSANEYKVYHRVAATIRALAGGGRVVIAGRGGAFITAGMPGGIYVLLVAPRPFRIEKIARDDHLTPTRAAMRLKQLERNRETFYKRHWRHASMDPEHFTITFNTADLNEAQMVEQLRCLIQNKR